MERISLENEELEGANNVYLFDTEERTLLVDTGEHARKDTLREALAEEEVAFGDIDDVLLTHWHPDHAGLAGTIQEAGGATVRIHEVDAPLVRRDSDAWAEFTETERARLEDWGVPEPKRQQVLGHRDDADVSERYPQPTVTPFTDGASFTVGDHELTCRHTPGHTAGSVCFELDSPATQGSELVTGDTLLPNYTPNVGGTDTRQERPLDEYLNSLYAIAAADYTRGWPGHREPIEDPAARAHEIIAHHEQRAGQILAILERIGPADVWSVCTELFGSLERFHILVGAGEAFAHLAHLEEQGDVEHVDGTYRLLDEVRADIDSDIDTWSLSVSEPELDQPR